jgi:hypothetical protein
MCVPASARKGRIPFNALSVLPLEQENRAARVLCPQSLECVRWLDSPAVIWISLKLFCWQKVGAVCEMRKYNFLQNETFECVAHKRKYIKQSSRREDANYTATDGNCIYDTMRNACSTFMHNICALGWAPAITWTSKWVIIHLRRAAISLCGAALICCIWNRPTKPICLLHHTRRPLFVFFSLRFFFMEHERCRLFIVCLCELPFIVDALLSRA